LHEKGILMLRCKPASGLKVIDAFHSWSVLWFRFSYILAITGEKEDLVMFCPER